MSGDNFYYGLKAISERMRVPPKTVLRLIDEGILLTFRLGGSANAKIATTETLIQTSLKTIHKWRTKKEVINSVNPSYT